MTAFVTMTPIATRTIRDKMLNLLHDGGYGTSSIRYLRDVAIVNLVWNTTEPCKLDWKPTQQFAEDIEEAYPLPMFKDATEQNVISMTKDWDYSKLKWCEALIDHDKECGTAEIYLVRIK